MVLPNSNLTEALAFLLSKEAWVRKKLAYTPKQIVINPNTLPLFGKYYSLQHIDEQNSKIYIHKDTILIYSTCTGRKKLLTEFLKSALLLEIERTVTELSKKYNLNFTKIRIMNNKTRVGKLLQQRCPIF